MINLSSETTNVPDIKAATFCKRAKVLCIRLKIICTMAKQISKECKEFLKWQMT